MQVARTMERSVIWGLLAILIMVASSALIRFVTSPAPASTEIAAKQQQFDSEQDKKFRSILESGRKSFADGEYTQALSLYREADRVVPQLKEEQYTDLKTARLQIAGIYENGGSRAEAETLYGEMIDSAFRDAAAQLHAGQPQAALERYQDVEKLVEHSGDGQKVKRIGASEGEVAALRRMNRFADAIQASQNLIDQLQAADEDDPGIVQGYMRMGETYVMQRDWEHVEGTLNSGLAVCDRILQHNSGVPVNQDPVWRVSVSKDQILYALIDVYDQDGKPDQALATADTLYEFITKYSTEWAELSPYGRNDVAKFAVHVATKAHRPDVASAWQAKINGVR